MRLSEPRVPRVTDPSTLEGEAAEMWPRYERDGGVPNIFATLINHPKLMKRWTVFGNHVLYKSTLPPRDRELLILRTGYRWQAAYEWSAHARIGREVGLTDDEISRVAEGPEAPGWDSFDAALLRAADELTSDAFIGDQTWEALSERYDTHQLMDVVFTVGQYTLVSMALNTLGVQLEEGMEGLPA